MEPKMCTEEDHSCLAASQLSTGGLGVFSSRPWSRLRVCLISLECVALLLLSGCVQYRRFQPTVEEQPVSVFGIYELTLKGHFSDTGALYTFGCELSPADSTRFTTSDDSVPRLWIDSFCFEDPCSEIFSCQVAMSWEEYLLRELRNGNEIIGRSAAQLDSTIRREGFRPSYFLLGDDVLLPCVSDDSTYTVAIFARLLDPITQDVIDIDSTRVQFFVNRFRKLYID